MTTRTKTLLATLLPLAAAALTAFAVWLESDSAPVPPPSTNPPTVPGPVTPTAYDLNTSAALLEAFNNKLDPLGVPDHGELSAPSLQFGYVAPLEGFDRFNSCYRWRGALSVPVDGEYEFKGQVKSAGWFILDGDVKWSFDREPDPGSHEIQKPTFTVQLSKGLHSIDLLMRKQSGEHICLWTWQKPGTAEHVQLGILDCLPPADWRQREKKYVPPPPEPLPFVVPDAGYRSPELAKLFPDSSPWNTPIDQAEVDPLSEAIIARLGDLHLHPVFGPGVGIPFEVVAADVPKVAVAFDYAGESDPGPYPLPAKPVLESGGGDGHWLGVQGNWLYELFYVRKQGGRWYAGSGAIFDLRTGERVPGWQPGWTSADAAGLPILPGLARYGVTDHALRISVPATRRAFIAPASHWASTKTDADLPPMGCRLRLKASIDESTFPEQARPIVRAAKRYGLIVADNGGPFLGLCGTPDARWDDNQLAALKTIKASDFVVTKMGEIVTEVR